MFSAEGECDPIPDSVIWCWSTFWASHVVLEPLEFDVGEPRSTENLFAHKTVRRASARIPPGNGGDPGCERRFRGGVHTGVVVK